MLVHLPGSGDSRPDLIREWTEKVRNENEKWEVPLVETSYVKNITAFWENDAPREKELQDTYWRRWHLLIRVGSEEDDLQREGVRKAEEYAKEQNMSDEMREEHINAVKEKFKKQKIQHLRDAEREKLKEEGLLEESADEQTKQDDQES